MVSQEPRPEGHMSIAFFKSPEVVQEKIAKNGYLNGNGRSYFKAYRKKTGEDEQEPHIHDNTRTSDNAEFN